MARDVAQLSDDELIAELTAEKKAIAKESIDSSPEGSLVVDLARSAIGQGVAFGFGDEIEAFARSKINGTSFEDEVTEIRAEIDRFREQNPGVAITAEIIGSLVVPGGAGAAALRSGASLGRLVASGARVGAATGAVAGFGAGEGGVEQRLKSAGVGAAVGGVGGAAVAPAIQGVTRGAQLAKRALSRPGARQEAIEGVARQTRDVDLGDVEQRALQAQQAGVDPNLIEAAELAAPGGSRGLVGTARAATSIPGPGQAKASLALEQRQAAQPAQLTEFIDRAFGADDFEATAAKLTDDIRAQANADYAALHGLPNVEVDGQLANLLRNKQVRSALKTAKKLAEAEGDTINIPNVGDPGTFIPVKTLDFLQRALRAKTIGSPSEKTVIFDKIRKRLLPIIDDRVPGFGETRARYADGKASEEALALGEKLALRLGAQQRDILKKFGRMDEPQKQLFRLGVARAIKDRIGNTSAGANQTRVLNTSGAQATLRRVLPPDTADNLIEQATVLGEQSATRGRVGVGASQGSRTTPLAEERAAAGENAALAANIILARPLGALQNIAQRTARGIDERNAEEIIDVLLEARPQELSNLISEIRTAQETIARSQTRRGAGAVATTSAAGQLAGREEGRRRANQ